VGLALKHREVLDLVAMDAMTWIPAAPTPMTAARLAARSIVAPASGVHRCAGEALSPGHVGVLRSVEVAGSVSTGRPYRADGVLDGVFDRELPDLLGVEPFSE